MYAPDLDSIVASHDLNQHPFYRAWRAGTLPRSKLVAYASEYAPFIGSIELGWRSLGENAHAETEGGHARLWEQFRDALGSVDESSCPQARALVAEARAAFADPVDAVGALYAFESQQPSTARSKLDGLREHYAIADGATEYFEAHADDYGEREHLRDLAAQLSPSDYARAARSCDRTCKAMWSALSGIFGECEAA